jgi:uncharacterized membrane protein YfcA
MLKKSNTNNVNLGKTNYFKLAILGFLVGLLIGFLGAGGGFLIIPALIFFANLDIKQAIGTSLLIITVNSIIGFSSDILSGISVDFLFLIKIASIAIIGMIIGTSIAKKMDGKYLKPIFGWFVLFMGLYIVVKELIF